MSGVNVSVEVPVENQIYEITYDGQEIQQPPLSMSENLSRLAQRIDFVDKDESNGQSAASAAGEPVKEPKESTEEANGDEATFKTTPAWPWEAVRTKLQTAMTELSVLGDIIAISQQKKYLVLDPVSSEPSETKPAATLMYKKKGLGAAAQVLLSGGERLRLALNEAKSKSSISSLPDFHIQLLRLRQNWRLRKVGNSILGDLSYRTAGSRFPQTGIFEVKKAEDNPDEDADEPSSTSRKPSSSALKVSVPNELQGIAYIEVVIQKDQETLSFANIGLPTPSPAPLDADWQQKLEAAQNVLFCKELFSVLAREAVSLHSLPIPPLVVGNQITATLFPGILLIISLCHSINANGKSSSSGCGSVPPVTPKPQSDHNHVLEHSLHQLLREVHRSNSCIPLPHPASAPVGISRKRRMGGPFAFDRQTLLSMTKKEGILEEIIRQSQHVVLRLRTMLVLDAMAREVKDPLITAHWASLNAVTHTSVRITLISSGYDMCARTPLVIHIKEKSLKSILKDGKAIYLSYEPQELRDLILAQIAIHQVMALQSLSKCMGWTVLSSSPHLGVGTCETIGNAAGCLLSSPTGKRLLAVRSSPQPHNCGIQVFVGYPPKSKVDGLGEIIDSGISGFSSTSTTQETLFESQNHESGSGIIYKPLKLDRMEGKNFLNKIEMLMAVLGDAE